MKNRNKVYSLLVCVMLVVSLIGCSRQDVGKESTIPSATTPSSQIPSTGGTDSGKDTEVYCFIAASLKNVMEEIQGNYKKIAPNVTLIFNPDSSGTLQTQIEEGAECDLFFSAATKQMTALSEGGYIVDGSVVNLLENKVVLIKPKGGETTVTSFETIPNAKNIALAGEDVPVGAYAREIFENLGITEKVLGMEINEGANVSAVLAAVSEASNEVGIVYATDAASIIEKVDIIGEAPAASLKTPVLYPVGLVQNKDADDVQAQAAKDFLAYLQTEDCLQLFQKYGFSINK